MVSNLKFSLSLFGRAMVGIAWALVVFILLGMFMGHPVGEVVVAVISIFFYLSFIYSGAWNQGFKDANYVKFGHMKEQRNRGLTCGLIAMIPNLLVAGIYYIGRYAIGGATFDFINMGTRFYFFPFVVPISQWVDSFPAIVAIVAVVIVPTAFIGYRLGYIDFSLTERLVYKNMGKKGKSLAAKKRGKRQI